MTTQENKPKEAVTNLIESMAKLKSGKKNIATDKQQSFNEIVNETTWASIPTTRRSFFTHKKVEETGNPRMLVNGQIRGGDVANSRSILIKLPPQIEDKMEKLTQGKKAPTMVALIEFALKKIEEEGGVWEVDNAN